VVAAEIVRCLKFPRTAASAPRVMGPITKSTGMLPRLLGDRLMTANGSDHLLSDAIASGARHGYERRAAAPAADARRPG
jgi:hypothetical protein